MKTYLARYGNSGFVGRFSASEEFDREEAVVLQTPRGRELGQILCPDLPADDRLAECGGTVVCRAELADRELVDQQREMEKRVLEALESRGIFVLECEILLDGITAIIEVSNLALAKQGWEELQSEFALVPHWEQLQAAPKSKGCSGCSSGGCSTGGCSSGGCSGCGTKKKAPQDRRISLGSAA